MMKRTFSKKRPSRQGTYLIKDRCSDEFEIIELSYCRDNRTWWISDYPYGKGSQPYEDDWDIEWYVKLS